MMATFVLHLCNSHGWLPDPQSEEFADLDAARDKAVRAIRDLVADDVTEGLPLNLSHFIAIRDADGKELERVTFHDAIAWDGPPPA